MTQIEFEHIDIELRIKDLIDYISMRRKNVQLKQTYQKKFDKWIEQLNTILDKISKIDEQVLPKIKQDFDYPFTKRNLVLIAFIQPSVKNTFLEIQKQFDNDSEFAIAQADLDLLERCSDVSGSLAWMGDAAIHYAISKNIWEPEITPEELDNKRKSLESDDNLSKLCDTWKLYNNRIHFDPNVPKQAKIIEIKGTLVEAIYGVIFIEKGIEGVQDAIDLIYQ